MATVEAKLAAQLAYLEQEPFFSIFFNLKKAFDAMDRGRCLWILEGYGVGPKMLRLIKIFWSLAEMVCGAGGGGLRRALWDESRGHTGRAFVAQAL
ncbi:hypothetical protein ACHAWF_000055 [Thalassiosira exigua]